MPKQKKYVQTLNLQKYRVWITDTDPFSRYFRVSQFPDVFTAGKNSFLINGSDELSPDTEVLVEIIDADGQTIFQQPIARYLDGLSRMVSIEIYEDTPPGLCTVTILGRLRQDDKGNLPPDNFKAAYNVKWRRTVLVDPFKPNISPIRLYRKPTLSVNEILVPYRDLVTGSTAVLNTGSINGVTSAGNRQYPQTVLIPSGFVFTRDMQDAVVAFNVGTASYSGAIDTIFNERLAQITPAYTASTLIQNFAPPTFSISYRQADTFSQLLYTRSYADVNINRLKTFSGDVQRAKIYYKSKDIPGDFQFLSDVTIDSTELTATASIPFGDANFSVGSIISQSVINTYWEGGTFRGTQYTASGVTLANDSYNLLDSLYVSSPTTMYSTGALKPLAYAGISAPLAFDSDSEYTLQGNVACFKSASGFDAKMEVYLFGSAFPSSSNSPYGTLIDTLEVPAGQTRQYFMNRSVNFTSTTSGSAYLRFVMYGGKWHIADTKIVSSNAFGFNPDLIRVQIPIINRVRFERLQFKVELFDFNSNRVPVDVSSDYVFFDGGNWYLRGSDNRMDGTLIVSPSGSGPLLSTRGFIDRNGNFTPGQMIAIGEPVPTVWDKKTAFFVGTSSFGPEISVGDKLYGYYDIPTDQFILIIRGTLLVGSGSSYTSLLSLLPGDTTDKYYDRVTGGHNDTEENRGRRAVSSGQWNTQIGRLGLYTRGYTGFISGGGVSSSLVSNALNPFGQSASVVMLATSTSIAVPSSGNIYNETIYGNVNLSLTQLPYINTGSYYLDYQLEVVTSWSGYPSLGASGQRLVRISNVVVTNSGSYSPPPIYNYPIPIPSPRTSDTLYILTKVKLTAVPSN
jgi:hypothetical protein